MMEITDEAGIVELKINIPVTSDVDIALLTAYLEKRIQEAVNAFFQESLEAEMKGQPTAPLKGILQNK